jgi:hypothetical protein
METGRAGPTGARTIAAAAALGLAGGAGPRHASSHPGQGQYAPAGRADQRLQELSPCRVRREPRQVVKAVVVQQRTSVADEDDLVVSRLS